MKTIRMRTTLAGPEFTAQAGDVIAVDDKQAGELLQAGHADEVEVEEVVMSTTFHGGLTPLVTGKREIVTPPNPDQSTAREMAFERVDVIDRRTADEVAADARLAAEGPVPDSGPVVVKSSDALAAEEVAEKVAVATGEARAIAPASRSAEKRLKAQKADADSTLAQPPKG